MMDSERGTGSSKVDHDVSVCQCYERGDSRSLSDKVEHDFRKYGNLWAYQPST